ncbi:MAG: sulfotransferase [Actinomycetota bacterium]|nr:sulfotransferase [Actinomycetota bacterium]
MDRPLPWSPYDAAVPHTTGLPGATARFDALRPARRLPVEDPLGSIREVVAVVSSSRGGSTLFGEILRRSDALLHLRAEVNPLFVVAGLGGGDARVLADELSAEMGNPAPWVGEEELHDLSLAVAWRLTAQWPELDIDPDDARRWANEAATGLGPPFDDRELHLRVLEQARRHLPGVNPYYYDLPTHLVAARFPDAPPPLGPPGEQLVEMPPFVLVRPWRRPDRAALGDRPLVLSTPRNAFRLPFLRALFPAARFRVVHLTRNPAASVNGLIDGWLHHGFFNVAVDEPLSIGGYTDAFPRWGDRWWCYDVPPAWRAFTGATLPEVCGEQWRSHHEAVLAFLEEADVDVCRVRFEDVVGPARAQVFAELDEWLGAGGSLSKAAAEDRPPVMATAPPRHRRWEQRADVLAPVLASEAVAEMAALLGYDDRVTWT